KETWDDCRSLPDSGPRCGGGRRRQATGHVRAVRARREPVTAILDPELWIRLVGIVVIDLTLAGDNALVIALAIRTLPPRQQTLGRIWGTAGAVGLRLAFIAVATSLLHVPLLRLGGGLLLVWIALKLVRQTAPHDHADHEATRTATSLRQAIWIIIVA